jgi:hypothetical protein
LEPFGPREARTGGRNPSIRASQTADYAFGSNPPYDLGLRSARLTDIDWNSTLGEKWILWMLGVNEPRKSHPAGKTPDA